MKQLPSPTYWVLPAPAQSKPCLTQASTSTSRRLPYPASLQDTPLPYPQEAPTFLSISMAIWVELVEQGVTTACTEPSTSSTRCPAAPSTAHTGKGDLQACIWQPGSLGRAGEQARQPGGQAVSWAARVAGGLLRGGGAA